MQSKCPETGPGSSPKRFLPGSMLRVIYCMSRDVYHTLHVIYSVHVLNIICIWHITYYVSCVICVLCVSIHSHYALAYLIIYYILCVT